MDIRNVRELVALYLKVPLIDQFYGRNVTLMNYYAESSMDAWRIGKGKIVQARVKVQNYIKQEIPEQREQKKIKDFVMYLLENDWFFDIGYKISACFVKAPQFLQRKDTNLCLCPCSYDPFQEYEQANENVKNIRPEEKTRHSFSLGRAFCGQPGDAIVRYSRESFLEHLQETGRRCMSHRALAHYIEVLYPGTNEVKLNPKPCYHPVPRTIHITKAAPDSASVTPKKRQADVLSKVVDKAIEHVQVKPKIVKLQKRCPPEYMKKKNTESSIESVKKAEKKKLTIDILLPNDILREIMSYKDVKEDIRHAQKSFTVNDWIDGLNNKHSQHILQYQSENSNELKDYAKVYKANMDYLKFTDAFKVAMEYLEVSFKQMAQNECSRYDDDTDDDDSSEESERVDALSDNSLDLPYEEYRKAKVAEKFQEDCKVVKSVLTTIIKKNLFFDFAFQLIAHERRTNRNGMLQRKFQIPCPCSKGYYDGFKDLLEEEDECPKKYFGDIRSFMAHLEKHGNCAIHRGLHCYLFHLYRPVCTAANVYVDLVCIQKKVYKFIMSDKYDCLPILRYVFYFFTGKKIKFQIILF